MAQIYLPEKSVWGDIVTPTERKSWEIRIFAKRTLNQRLMRKSIFAIALLSILLACQKENTTTPKEPEVSTTDIEALRKEIEELRTTVESLKLNTGNTEENECKWASAEEVENLKRENEELKSQIQLLTSGFFEVDGLRFDKNGTLISTQVLDNQTTVKTSGNITLTTTRSYDAEGRVIEIMRKYSGYNSISSLPYYWRQELFEYNGKKCKETVRTNKYGLPAGTQYEEVITETTYW